MSIDFKAVRNVAVFLAFAGMVSAANAKSVRVSDNIGFYYFISAGYLVSQPGKLPKLGVVEGDFTGEMTFGTPQKVYVKMENALVAPGDFLVVYRDTTDVHSDRVGWVGRQVENLAILEVLEVQKDSCLAITRECFEPFRDGDAVMPYAQDVARWSQAQRRKPLPEKMIRCDVAGGKVGSSRYSQNDWIVLTAGRMEGVVEGQVFELRQRDPGDFGSTAAHEPIGKAQVFYAGPHYSMAQITQCSAEIHKGFEAWFRP
ncbi:MAG: hypothetical protein ACREL1_03760 [bacterium]